MASSCWSFFFIVAYRRKSVAKLRRKCLDVVAKTVQNGVGELSFSFKMTFFAPFLQVSPRFWGVAHGRYLLSNR